MAETAGLVFIANPEAGRGRVGRHLADLLPRLGEEIGASRVLETKQPGHAAELVRDAVAAGTRSIVAVGGDGTVHEVVNALLDDSPSSGDTVTLSVVPVGSGCDFARTFDLPRDGAGQARYLSSRRAQPIDVGRIVSTTPTGPRTTFFANIAEIGLGGDNVRRAASLPRFLGGTRYSLAFWATLLRYRPCRVSVAADGGRFAGHCLTVTVANGQYFGGGMWISPHSDPADGRLDVQVSFGPKRQAVTVIPQVYRGTHLPSDNIVQFVATDLRIDAERPIPAEADGEVLGTTPVEITVVPQAVRLRLPEAPPSRPGNGPSS